MASDPDLLGPSWANRPRLRGCGFTSRGGTGPEAAERGTRVEDVGGCAVSEPRRLDSHRGDGTRAGRMRAVIGLASLLLLTLLPACPAPAPDPQAGVADAQAALRDGHPEQAEAALRERLARRPDDPLARAVLGRALHAQRRFREAAVQSRLALGQDPELWQAAYNLACHYSALGDNDQAIHWLQAALSGDQVTREQVQSDPDLAPLLPDHRMAFYLAGGTLNREQEDAVAGVLPRTVAVGEPATLSVVALSLNRPLMGERHPLELRPLRPLPDGALAPRTRRETFSTGEEGGREYSQRSLHFGFLPALTGMMPLGPFLVREGERERRTNTALLEVTPGEPPAPGPGRAALGGAFFRAPSEVDEQLIADHVARGGALVELDPTNPTPVDPPWTPGPEADSRVFRYRAADLVALPASLPPRQEPVLRSILVQRASEGWSHILELRPHAL